MVVPAYEEGAHLETSLRRLVACLERTARDFEVVVVDDGSRDATAAAAGAVLASDPRVRLLRHGRNRGKGAALTTGCAAAGGDVVVLLDADLDVPPEEIAPLVARLEEEGADVAVGSKYHPGASQPRPWHRRALSRLYQVATALAFRLPLRDTQTGLKVLRRRVARELVPRLRSRRFAWDVELLLLAGRRGLRITTGPVRIAPTSRGYRIGWREVLLAGADTLRLLWADRALGRYGHGRAVRPRTRIVVCGDDLGLDPAADEGLAAAARAGALTAVSALVTREGAGEALVALPEGTSVGLHLDLLGGGGLPALMGRALRGRASARVAEAAVAAQAASLASRGFPPTHLDAHRHAWALPGLRRGAVRGAARTGIGVVRALRPLGPPFASGALEGAKRLLLLAAHVAARDEAPARGLVRPDGHVDVRSARRWVQAGRLPPWVRGRLVEVIAHPARAGAALPPGEAHTIDRAAETRALLDPPLAPALRALGAEVLTPRALLDGRGG